MTALLITSLAGNAGKTMLCAGLGKKWLDSGKKVGYLKIAKQEEFVQPDAGKDVIFLQKVLNIEGPAETFYRSAGESSESLKQAYQSIAQNKDMVIVEVSLSVIDKSLSAVNGPVLAIHDYSNPLLPSISEYKKLEDRLLGVVINKVPRKNTKRYQEKTSAQLSQSGIVLWGIIPEDRILMAPSVADLAETVKGKILNNEESTSELIENMMLGSSTFDRGTAYYTRKENKAVILWGERPGFRKAVVSNYQLAALQTSTRCIIVGHSGLPVPGVAQKAEERKIPFVSAPGTVPEMITSIENAMENLKFTQHNKLPRLLEILEQNVSLNPLETALGLVER